MKMQNLRRSIALLLVFVLCFATAVIPGAAIGEQQKVKIIGFPRLADPNCEEGDWGHDALNLMNGWKMPKGDGSSLHAMDSYSGNICYCIEPGVAQSTDDEFISKDEGFWENYPDRLNKTISGDEIKLLIGRIFQYGYTGPVSTEWYTTNEGAEYLSKALATQMLVWETVVGERDADFNKVTAAGYDSISQYIKPAHPLYSKIMGYYNSIVSSVKLHTTLPSFCVEDSTATVPVELKWDGEKYTATLTDTNNVLANYSFTADQEGIEFEIRGNQLIITAKEAPNGIVNITVPQNNSERTGLVTWSDGNVGGGRQDMVTYTEPINDPITGYLSALAALRAQVKLVKVDADSGKAIAYAGAGFEIYDNQGNLITQQGSTVFYTNAEGCLLTPEALEAGEGYYLVEVQAPAGYVLDAAPIYFDVTEESAVADNGIVVVKLTKENKAQLGDITVIKTGEIFASVVEDNGLFQPVYQVTRLAGAVYEISAAEDIVTADGTVHYRANDLVATVTTGENGTALTGSLPLGKYAVREIAAPVGMTLSDEVKIVELTYAGQDLALTHAEVTFHNERQTCGAAVNKVMESDQLFEIYGDVTDVSFGLYAGADIVAADGSMIPNGGLIEVIGVNADGSAAITADLPMGSYYLQEITTAEGYICSTVRYPFVFEYAGQDTEVVYFQLNNGEPVINEIIYGNVRGMKISDTLQPLSGAVIGLFRADETEFTEETALLVTVSDENGAFGFDGVAYGKWIIAEIEAPTGYLLTEERFAVEIDEDGDLVELLISNTAIRGGVRVQKVDEADPTAMLSGAVFEVYRDVNGDALLDEGDVLVGTLTEGEKGLYELSGLTYGCYFLKEAAAPAGFNPDQDIWYFEICEDGQIITIANMDDGLFGNVAQIGALRIVKTSDDNVVAGITFLVEGTDLTGGTFSQEYVTDENGEIFIEGLRAGTYVISEVSNEATAKYELPADVTVEIRCCETAEAKFHNKLLAVEDDDDVKTGDSANLGLWAAAVLLSMAGIAATGVMYCNDQRKKI